MTDKQSTTRNLFLDYQAILHRVAACAPVVVWAYDCQGIVQLAEGSALAALGFNDHELIGRSVFEIYQNQPELLSYVERVLAGESFVANVNISDVYLEVHYSPIRDEQGDMQGVIGIAIDITSHIKTTQALQESEERSTYAQRVGQIGIWDWNILSDEVYWSDIIEPMFGFERGQFAGTYAAFLKCVHPEDRKTIRKAIKATIKKNSPYKLEHRIIWPDKSVHWLSVAGEVFRDAQGKPVHMLGVVQDATERINAERELRQSQQDLEVSQQLAHVGTWSLNPKDNSMTWSRELYRIHDLSPDTCTHDLWELSWLTVHPQDRKRLEKAVAESMQNPGQDIQCEYRLMRADGEVRTVWAVGTSFADSNGKITKVIGIIQDITEKTRAAEVTRKLSRALEQTDDLVIITDRDGNIEFVNSAFETTTGYTRDEFIGKKPNLLRSGEHDDSYYKHMWETILSGNSFQDVMVNRRKDGSIFYEQKTITPLQDQNGQVTHFISTGKDITQRIQDQQRVQFLAHHDVLTELPNRALFSDRLEHALQRRHEHDTQLALIFMDLDRFKIINDTLGHDAGDRFLQSLSERLLGCLRAEDTIARLGGDEFAVLLEDVESIEQVAGVARKIIDCLAMPVVLDRQELFITASLGISVYPLDGRDSRTLLKNADIAMYRAKDLGRNSYQFFSSDMSTKALERLTFETSLRHALAREEFVLHYQPQFDLKQQQNIAVEALLRWQHPDLGLVSPGEFISILEETGLIVDVGEWVLRQACQQAQEWNKTLEHPIQISINVSTRQFTSSHFGETLQAVLSDTSLDAKFLTLEITESLLLQSTPHLDTTFKRLMDNNVQLALDDFGTGYSSLSYLKRFPISALKIDRSFIRDIVVDPEDASIVEAIIALSRSLGMRVVAEGVETLEQKAFLNERGCETIQGFLFSPPIVAQKIPEILSNTALNSPVVSA